MKIDFSAKIIDLNEQPIRQGDRELTLGGLCVGALLADYADERSISSQEKVRRFELALVVHKEAEVDLKAEDVALIKTLIGKGCSPLGVGRAWSLLDPSPGA